MTQLQELLEQIRSLEARVRDEIQRQARDFGYTLRRGRVIFERDVIRHHKRKARRLWRYLFSSPLSNIIGNLLTAPIVYSLWLPFVLLDVFVTVYQHICFRIYGIPRVRRRDYVVVDRHRLRYLNIVERMNCFYCGYGNGVIAYVQEVGAHTEQYWCPIKHARALRQTHSTYHTFADYGDADGYLSELNNIREKLRDIDDASPVKADKTN